MNIICPQCYSNKVKMLYPSNIDPSKYMNAYNISESDYGEHMDIYKCLSCSLVFVDTTEIKDILLNYYSHMNDQEYEKERDNRSLSFKRVLDKAQTYTPKGTLLDIGCATGALMGEAKKRGYIVKGIEPSDWAAQIAVKVHKLDVETGFLEDKTYPNESFDIILMLDVIEHLLAPTEALQRIRGWLKKGGLLCIVTPNNAGILPKLLKDKWWHIRPAHLFYFTHKTISVLLTKYGFEVLNIRTYKWNLSFTYLLERLFKIFGLKLPGFITTSFLKDICVRVDLYDSMEIYARKI